MNLFTLLTKNEIEKYVKIKNYTINQVIFTEGDYCDELGIVIEGKIIVSTDDSKANNVTITMINTDGLFGHYLIFLDEPRYLGTAIAATKTKVAIIKKNNLLKLLKENDLFLTSYLQKVSSEAFTLKQEVKLFAHKNIRERIMHYLMTKQINNKVIINSVTDLATILSLPRPSVSRELSKLCADKIIKKENNIIYLLKTYN